MLLPLCELLLLPVSVAVKLKLCCVWDLAVLKGWAFKNLSIILLKTDYNTSWLCFGDFFKKQNSFSSKSTIYSDERGRTRIILIIISIGNGEELEIYSSHWYGAISKALGAHIFGTFWLVIGGYSFIGFHSAPWEYFHCKLYFPDRICLLEDSSVCSILLGHQCCGYRDFILFLGAGSAPFLTSDVWRSYCGFKC